MGQIETEHVTLRDGTVATLRHAVPEDAEGLLTFMTTVLPETEFLLMEPSEFQLTAEQERKWVQSHLDDPNGLAMVAVIDGKIVSSAGVKAAKMRRRAHVAELGISILARYCDRGLGGKLMDRLIAFAERSPGIEKVALSVYAHNTRAIALYKKHGFVEEGRSPRAMRYADGRYADDVRMARFVKRHGVPGTEKLS